MSNQNACKATLTVFTISKWPYKINKLMFSSTLKQNLANAAMRIVSIHNLYKKLCPAYHLNISSLKAHMPKIVNIL